MSDHADVQSVERPAPAGPAHPSPAGQPLASPLAPDDFSAVLHRVEDASKAWNIQPELAEGRFVSAMMAAISWSGRVTQTAQAEWRSLFKSERDAAEMELARAREITKAVNAALGQARSALLGLQEIIEVLLNIAPYRGYPGVQRAMAIAGEEFAKRDSGAVPPF